MFGKIRQALVALTQRHDAMETGRDVRRLLAMAAKGLRSGTFKENVEGVAAVAETFARVTGRWLSVEDVVAGREGVFDACDLEVWLALAAAAGVPAVPARRILSLDEDEAAIASGAIQVVEKPQTRRIAAMAREAGIVAEPGSVPPEPTDAERERIAEAMAAAMDDVPEGWMVRSARCGSSNLKTLAGAGVAGPAVPEVRFGPDLEFGPGWIRRGNRRAVDATDRRTVESMAQAPEGSALRFLARPWVTAARWGHCADPHRHNTALRGEGLFPAEWRAYVEDGRVTGVSAYYGWVGAATPRNARVALEVRAMAQRIVDEAAARRLTPRHTDVALRLAMAEERFAAMAARFAGIADAGLRADADLARVHADWTRDAEAVADALRRFPADGVSATLDFMEAMGGPGEHGLVLLEGGPAYHPLGGGHCCAFSGVAGRPYVGVPVKAEGVAFRVMDHVSIAEMDTWATGEEAGRILGWDAVEALAARDGDPDAVPDGWEIPEGSGDYRSMARVAAAAREREGAR